MELIKIITVELFSTPDIIDLEVILATHHKENFRGIFLYNNRTNLVEHRTWVSEDLPENVLMDYMLKILQGQEIKVVGHG